MADLSVFTDEELELLISLPYRAGVFVSYADDAPGDKDDAREMMALKSCLKEVAEQLYGPGLVDDVLRETLRHEDRWERWAEEGAFNVISAAKQAIALLQAKASPEDVQNYRAAVLDISRAVAQAYGEFVEYEELPEEDEGFFAKLAEKIVSGLSVGSALETGGDPGNVSASEDSAIQKLDAAMEIEG